MTGRQHTAGVRGVPRGVQPERGGLLVCLYCGQAFKFLAPHLKQKHGVSADEYKDEFELPKRGLISEALREARQAHARHLLATDKRVRDGIMRKDPVVQRERLGMARASAAQAIHKAGVREILQANGRHAALVSAQARRDALERRAQELGFTNLGELLYRMAHLSNPELGKLLGCTSSGASSIRVRHGAPSQHLAHKRMQREIDRHESRSRAFEAELRRLGPDLQPFDADGRWLCRQCGAFTEDFAEHVEEAHQLSAAIYVRRMANRQRLDQIARGRGYQDLADLLRRTTLMSRDTVAAMLGYSRRNLQNLYQCYPDLPVSSKDVSARRRSLAASGAQQGKRARTRERHDRLAREHGYPAIADLLAATMHLSYKQVAVLLNVPFRRVQFLRQHYR